MQKKFISNLVLLVLLNLIVKPISIFGIDAAVQNRVGSADYGLYFSLLNFTYLFNILLDFGINNYTTKNVAQYPALMKKYIGKIAGLRLVFFIVYAFITLGLALILQYDVSVYPILTVLIVQQFIIGMIAYFRSYLSGLLLFKLDALLSVLDRFLLIVLCGSALYLHTVSKFTITTFIWMQFASYAISFLVGLVLVVKNAGKIKVSINKHISYLITRQSLPYALLIILMMLFTRIDSVMIERMLPDGAKQAGIYAQGFRLLDAFFMFAMLFSNLLLPLFSKMIATKENVQTLLLSSSKLLIWGSIALTALCFWNAFDLLDLIYNNDVSSTVLPFQLLMFTFISMCITLIFGTYLTALGSMRTLNTIAGIGLVLNIAINLVLIPSYGVVGAAYATLITQSFVALAEFVVVVKLLNLSFSLKSILVFPLYCIVVFGGLWLQKKYSLNIALQGIFIGICLLLFKVVNVQFLRNLLSKNAD